jgi:gliding motility-associated protein GldE
MIIFLDLINYIDWSVIAWSLLLTGLIFCSGLISASEVAYFSLSPNSIRTLEEASVEDSNAQKILDHINDPKSLLATLLIVINFINVAIVIVAEIIIKKLLTEQLLFKIATFLEKYITGNLFTLDQLANGFYVFVTVVLVTIILLLFGEISPKLYANLNNIKVAKMMASPLKILSALVAPLRVILVRWGSYLEDRIAINGNNQLAASKEDLDHAIELTVNRDDSESEDAELLKGIVNFGELSAKQVMKPRVDLIALDKTLGYKKVLEIANESGYSRMPVYEEDLDQIFGILHIKDLIGYIHEGDEFDWQALVKTNLLFIPETKKIDDLLREFQAKKLHMAFVVNEFGGTLGIVTLEDVMEEVLGEINDETDVEDDIDYVKLGEGNFIFDGKTLLNDVCRLIGERFNFFDDDKGNADSIGGMLIEKFGSIPKAEKEIIIKNQRIKVVASTSRRIEKVNIKKIEEIK